MDHHDPIQAEFERAAAGFARRTRGRFDDMDVASFAPVGQNDIVVEVGAGTGNFLDVFSGTGAHLIGVDLTEGMLQQLHAHFPEMSAAVADGARLPFSNSSVDLVASAQMLHHVHEPIPILREMRRVVRPEGRVLIVDQVATERYEEVVAMNRLELVRDPSHAASRPPSAFRTMLIKAGLEIEAERTFEGTQRLSAWMGRDEFPPERHAAVLDFIEEHGPETGMDFHMEDGEWAFTRRRIMLLAKRL